MDKKAKTKVNAMEIPEQVRIIVDSLETNGFPTYLVGGACRDLFLGLTPQDWDLATGATPDDIHKSISRMIPTAKCIDTGIKHLTVTVLLDDMPVEVTTFRKESEYSDGRHPDSVAKAKDIFEDLARRDFTINAVAWRIATEELIDPFNGLIDMNEKSLKAVGDPKVRIKEDRLRALRAIRFANRFELKIEPNLLTELYNTDISTISVERIKAELLKMLSSPRGLNRRAAVEDLLKTGLMRYIIPELYDSFNISGGDFHAEDVKEHSLSTLEYCPSKDPLLNFVCLLHDIGKPYVVGRDITEISTVKEIIKNGGNPSISSEWLEGRRKTTFYSHDIIGSVIIDRIMRRLRFSNHDIDYASKLVRWHLFNYRTAANPEQGGKRNLPDGTEIVIPVASDKFIKRLVNSIGEDNILDMCMLNWADRMGNHKKRSYTMPFGKEWLDKYTIINRWKKIKDEHTAFSIHDVNLDGTEIGKILGVTPGPIIHKAKEMLFEAIEDKMVENEKSALSEFLIMYYNGR